MDQLPSEEIQKTLLSLIEIVECPVCLEKVRPDVQCVNRHLLCSECRGNLDECPTCRGDFSDEKPTGILLQLVEALPRRCKQNGCGRYIKGNDDHQKYCKFKPARCLVTECQWSGTVQTLLSHVKEEHPTTEAENVANIVFNDFNLNESHVYFKLHLWDGHLIWHKINYSFENKMLTHSFLLVPNEKPKDDIFVRLIHSCRDTKFKAKFKLNIDPDLLLEDANYIAFPAHTVPQIIDDENIFKFSVSVKA